MPADVDTGHVIGLSNFELPDKEHLSRVWNLLADAQESVDAVTSSVLYRVNGKSDAPVSPELVGRLAVFVKNIRDLTGWIEESGEKIDRSLYDLLSVADGDTMVEAVLDECGKPTTDWQRSWQEDVSDALGIPRPGGAWGPELAARIAATMAANADDAE